MPFPPFITTICSVAVDKEWEQPGSILRSAREAKGLTIMDVSHRTKIPVRIIEALENDDYASFSSPTYARSFLSQYADFVGIDSSLWLDFFEPTFYGGSQDVFSIVSTPSALPSHSEGKWDQPRRPNRTRGVSSTLVVLFLTIGLVLLAVEAWKKVEPHFANRETAPPPQVKPEFVTDAPKVTLSQKPQQGQAHPAEHAHHPSVEGALDAVAQKGPRVEEPAPPRAIIPDKLPN